MKNKLFISMLLMGAAIAVLACVFLAAKKPAPPAVVRAASPPPALVATVATQTEAAAAPEILAVEKSADGSPAPKKSAANAKPKPPKPEIQDPDAREALSLVGVDPTAEQYWISAINNDKLPADERRELIEDLNQDGFMDKKNPGPEDFQLIISRIQLIEELAPSAKDQVNADAFGEAYGDLLKMLTR